MRKRPSTYQDFRELYHQALYLAGSAATARLMAIRDGKPVARYVRWEWEAAYRAHRLETRMHAYFEAMGNDVCEEIMRWAMGD